MLPIIDQYLYYWPCSVTDESMNKEYILQIDCSRVQELVDIYGNGEARVHLYISVAVCMHRCKINTTILTYLHTALCPELQEHCHIGQKVLVGDRVSGDVSA